ncbi:hypothetical protein BCEN4_760003 [Burkholderia cenocepacia]|nr:hypothetical protein BCEN4_760003 [Burkholderia cenocepacia]
MVASFAAGLPAVFRSHRRRLVAVGRDGSDTTDRKIHDEESVKFKTINQTGRICTKKTIHD